MTTQDFRAVIRELTGATTLQGAAQPLLASLSTVTRLECTFLTRVGRGQRRQRVLLSHHPDEDRLVVPQGYTAAWNGSLCKRALDERVHYTMAAERLWPDHPLTRDLGVRTFMSQPIHDRSHLVIGTLCAASGRQVAMAPQALPVLRLFAELLRGDIEYRQARAVHHEQHQDRCARAVDEVLEDMDDHGLALRHTLGRACGLTK